MAENGRDFIEETKPSADKEARLRSLKDRQNEERQKKLEEIKAQALAAQRFKEQKEQERRARLEELRTKDDVRRQQVEDRKRAINDAERDRLESILRRNQEREHRIEAKKRNERSNIVFAFGSSTPRMLDPSDMTVSFWGHRKATSIQNITCTTTGSSLTRRQSERDLDVGNKKRATSATGLERSGESSTPVTPAGCASGYLGRRRTDLVPTIPTRDSSHASSRKSLNHSPGRAYSMSRLDQLAKPRRRPDLPSLAETTSPNPRPLSSPRHSSVTRSMSHLAVKSGPSPTRRTLNMTDSRSMHHLAGDGVGLVPRTTRTSQLREQKLHASSNCSEASSRPSSSLSQQSTNSVASSVSIRHRPSATPRRPRPASIAVTGITHDIKNSGETKPPLPKTRKSLTKTHEKPVLVKNKIKSPVDSVSKDKSSSLAQSIVNKAASDETQQKPPDTAPGIQQKPASESRPPQTVMEVVQPASENDLQKDSNKVVPGTEKSDIELVSENKVLKEIKTAEAVKIVEEKREAEENKLVDNIPLETKKAVEAKQTIKEIQQEKKPVEEKKLVEEKKPVEERKSVEENKPDEQSKPGEEKKPVEEKKLEEITLEQKQTNDTPRVEIKKEAGIEGTVKVEQAPQAIATTTEVLTETVMQSTFINIENKENTANNEMSASMTKIRLNTEEEAKAALAERRRLIREEAERQAEMERLRLEAEAKAELERQQKEEEQVRQLIELQRQAEQERLKEAIRETQKREEEERLKREEDQRLKLLKEEAERKAREDAEKQKAELQERLKNEEKEREARRKRVEAIMLRTRGKNNANLPSQQSADDKNENENKSEENRDNEESKVNGTKIVEQENGTTKNGKDVDIVDNIIPGDIVKNANTVTIDTMNSTDSINSNNTWQDTQQYGNFLYNNNS